MIILTVSNSTAKLKYLQICPNLVHQLWKFDRQPMSIFEELILMNRIKLVPVARLQLFEFLLLIICELHRWIFLNYRFSLILLLLRPLNIVPRIEFILLVTLTENVMGVNIPPYQALNSYILAWFDSWRILFAMPSFGFFRCFDFSSSSSQLAVSAKRLKLSQQHAPIALPCVAFKNSRFIVFGQKSCAELRSLTVAHLIKFVDVYKNSHQIDIMRILLNSVTTCITVYNIYSVHQAGQNSKSHRSKFLIHSVLHIYRKWNYGVNKIIKLSWNSNVKQSKSAPVRCCEQHMSELYRYLWKLKWKKYQKKLSSEPKDFLMWNTPKPKKKSNLIVCKDEGTIIKSLKSSWEGVIADHNGLQFVGIRTLGEFSCRQHKFSECFAQSD